MNFPSSAWSVDADACVYSLVAVPGSRDDEAPPCCLTEVRDPDSSAEANGRKGPPKGTFLDETITLRGSEGIALVEKVMQVIASEKVLRRRPHAAELQNERDLLACMLANGLRCQWHRDPPLVAYQRKADAYSTKRNKPQWLSGQALSRTADFLARTELIQTQLGERETSSTYQLHKNLLALAEQHGISESSLQRQFHREDLVRLKGRKPKSTFDPWMRTLVRHKGDRIYFDPTDQTEQWCDQLAAYNEFVTKQNIHIQLQADIAHRWIGALNSDLARSGADFYRPELFRCSLYRVFNDGNVDDVSFDTGGRLAGAWWINAPKEVRARIVINGEPTVELDYSSCHPRMLYHEQGLEAPDDLYSLPELAEIERQAGLQEGYYRSGVKWLTQVLINGRGRPDLVDVPTDVSLPDAIPINDLAALIERQHAPIASAFRTGAGLRLMKTESDIALGIMTKAMTNGWTILPVHDSYISPISVKDEIRTFMIEEYHHKVGKEPIIN